MKSFRGGNKDLFTENFNLDEDLDNVNIEENHRHYVAILVKSLCLLGKLPYAIDVSILLIVPLYISFFYSCFVSPSYLYTNYL